MHLTPFSEKDGIGVSPGVQKNYLRKISLQGWKSIVLWRGERGRYGITWSRAKN